VSESCRARITGWPNPRVYWPNAVAFRCSWEKLGVPVTRLGAPMTGLGAPATSLGTPRITVGQSGRNNIIFGNTAGAPGKLSYNLSFNDF